MAALQRQRAATLSLTHLTARRSADTNRTHSHGASAPVSQAAASPAPARSQPGTYGTAAGVGSPNPSPDSTAGAPAGAPRRVGAPDAAELVFGGATDGGIAVWDVSAAAEAAAGVSCDAASGPAHSSSAAGREPSANHHATGGTPVNVSHSVSSNSMLHAPSGAASADAGVERKGLQGAARAGGAGGRRGVCGEGAAAEVAHALALPGAHQSGVNALSVARCGAPCPALSTTVIIIYYYYFFRERMKEQTGSKLMACTLPPVLHMHLSRVMVLSFSPF